VVDRFCTDCGTRTPHKPFKSGLYKYNGERVKTCKKCGELRTNSEEQVREAEMIHVPSQKKYKNR